MPRAQHLQNAVLDCLSELEELSALLNRISDAPHLQQTCSSATCLPGYIDKLAFATRTHRLRLSVELEQCRL